MQPDIDSRPSTNITAELDYTKIPMSELHLRQLAITKEIHTRAQVSQIQLGESIKQNKTSAARLQEIEQQKKEAEQTTTTLLQALDEACRSLSDSDIQETEEPK